MMGYGCGKLRYGYKGYFSLEDIGGFSVGPGVARNNSGIGRWGTLFLLVMAGVLSGCDASLEKKASGPSWDIRGGFVGDDEDFRVDPMDFPVFSPEVSREVPNMRVGQPYANGIEAAPLMEDEAWVVTHKVYGEYLIGSDSYDRRSCEMAIEKGIDKGDCKNGYSSYFKRMYLKPTASGGIGFAWANVKNKSRWDSPEEKRTWFKADKTGKWIEPPRFRCIARCDKLKAMVVVES